MLFRTSEFLVIWNWRGVLFCTGNVICIESVLDLFCNHESQVFGLQCHGGLNSIIPDWRNSPEVTIYKLWRRGCLHVWVLFKEANSSSYSNRCSNPTTGCPGSSCFRCGSCTEIDAVLCCPQRLQFLQRLVSEWDWDRHSSWLKNQMKMLRNSVVGESVIRFGICFQ